MFRESLGPRAARAAIAVCALFIASAGGLTTISVSVARAAEPPTLSSDQADYAPGATVTLRGANWQPAESVRIVVNDSVGQTWQRDVTVHADTSGTITDSFSLPNYFVSDYDATATGAVSGVATTSFTDNDTYDWSQCKNDSAGGIPLAGGVTNDNTIDPCQWVN